MSEKVCETCVHYEPSADFEGCGVCTEESLWQARSQEVRADMHACAALGSRWEPLTVMETPPVDVAEVKKGSRLPAEAIWLRRIGVGGLLVSPVVFFIDLFVGIPGIPELFLLWFLLFAGVTVTGYLWDKL